MKTSLTFPATFLVLSTIGLARFVCAADVTPLALNFDGSSNYVAVPHTAALNAFPLTVMAWVNTSQGTNQQGLVNKYVANSLNGWNVFLRDGHLRAWYFVNNTRFVWDGANGMDGGFIADGLWHHIAFTVATNGGQLYVDGVLKDARGWNGAPGATTTTQEMRLGSYPAGSVAFNGLLDEISVWNVALSQGQIQTNMNQILAGTEPGLLAYFRCQDGTGPIVADSAPLDGNNNGAWNGAPLFVLSGVQPPLVFTNINVNFGYQNFSSLACGDFDNDGRLDLALSGRPLSSANDVELWRNTGGGFAFARGIALGLHSLSWGDFDNDNSVDLLVATSLYQNRDGGFLLNTNVLLLGGGDPFGTVWGDFDNDGRLDVLCKAGTLFICRNTGANFVETNLAILGIQNGGSVDLGDYDNDGNLDIALIKGSTIFNAQILRNTGHGFTNVDAGLPKVAGSIAWGDYDNDGRLDILLAGTINVGPTNDFVPQGIAQVWRNTGNGFTNINAALPAISGSHLGVPSVAWADFDNDGRLDILLSGGILLDTNGTEAAVTQIWRNTGSGFTNINAGLPGLFRGSIACGDYDSDGRVDVALAGVSKVDSNGAPSDFVIQVWHNNLPLSNTPPTAPTNLHVAIVDDTVSFRWNAATDAQTPASGLTYNLRVGTTPGGCDLISPMALPSGQSLLPTMGNAQHRTFSLLHGLPPSQTFYWSVQAIDTSFAGSPFAPESSFSLHNLLAPPGSTNVVFGDSNGDGLVDETEFNVVLSNFLANSPFLKMTNVAGLGGTNVTFALTNSLFGALNVEYSTNLQDWFPLGPATPRYEFIDTNAPATPQRYYRLRLP